MPRIGKLRRPRKRRAPAKPPGAPPGTLVAPPDAPAPVLRVLAYGPERFTEQQIEEPEAVRDFLDEWPVVWLNVDGLGDAEVLGRVGQVFGLHPLALEDVLHTNQRPKIEPYGPRLFLISRMPQLDEGGLITEQLALFLGENFVLTFQERPGDSLEPVRNRLRNGRGLIRDAPADYLAYALIDAVVDSYFPILDRHGERLEQLEDEVVGDPTPETIREIHGLKSDLLVLRRAIWPQRDVLNSLIRDPSELVTDDTRVYLRDCYDHSIRVMDLLETYREIGTHLTDLYLSSVSNRMNEVMRVLTVMATIFIPLTFIAGVYGMNFDTTISPWNMPELHWRWGYPAVLGLMAGVALALLYYFRRKRWI